jgi:glycerophosphoryl diester phosphodiesterase
LIAHRANASGSIDNSTGGIATSLALGIKTVEMDVRVSKDNVVYLYHDAKIGDRRVAELTFREITE